MEGGNPHRMVHQMATPVGALNGQYLDPDLFCIARTQREARIESLDWEYRLRRLRSISQDIGVGIRVTVLIAAAIAARLLL
jgi:hypothetical protein